MTKYDLETHSSSRNPTKKTLDACELTIKGGRIHHWIVHSHELKAGMNYLRVYMTTLDSSFPGIKSGNELSKGVIDHLG